MKLAVQLLSLIKWLALFESGQKEEGTIVCLCGILCIFIHHAVRWLGVLFKGAGICQCNSLHLMSVVESSDRAIARR